MVRRRRRVSVSSVSFDASLAQPSLLDAQPGWTLTVQRPRLSLERRAAFRRGKSSGEKRPTSQRPYVFDWGALVKKTRDNNS